MDQIVVENPIMLSFVDNVMLTQWHSVSHSSLGLLKLFPYKKTVTRKKPKNETLCTICVWWMNVSCLDCISVSIDWICRILGSE